MARLTAQDMVEMVRDSLGGETSETISDTRILRFINQSYLELCSQYGFDQIDTDTSITTAASTAEYELSVSDVMEITNVVDTTNTFALLTMSEDQYHDYTQGGSTTGTPYSWYIDGVGSNNRWNIKFWPTPAGIYTIKVYYKKVPAELVLSPAATSAIIPEAWDDSIIYRAVARGWMMLGDPDAAGKWRQTARANDQSAYKTAYHPSQLPERVTSRVARALRDV